MEEGEGRVVNLLARPDEQKKEKRELDPQVRRGGKAGHERQLSGFRGEEGGEICLEKRPGEEKTVSFACNDVKERGGGEV